MASGTVYLLHPGDVVCAERGDTLETLLGSCIAVLLSDRKRTVAAMRRAKRHTKYHGSAIIAYF